MILYSNELSQFYNKYKIDKVSLKISPFRRADFTSSDTLQPIRVRLLQLHGLHLSAKANSPREISGLKKQGRFKIRFF